MNLSQDYQKFLKSKKINSTYISHYSQKSTQFIEDGGLIFPNDIFNRLLKDRIIILSGEIDTHISELIKANLLYLESLNSEEDITLYINSPGGSVYDGLGLLDIMEYIKPEIGTINTGLAASMAAIILSSGAKGKRKALKRSRTMIHQPMGGYSGWAQASDLEIDAKEINELKKQLYEIISEKSGQTYTKVEKDGDRDYWLSANDAKRYGLIDEVLLKRR
jgi:ATP-dependent Clp protease protease subunit